MGVRAATGTEHRYQLCRDEDCEKFLCRVYKEGRRDGWEYGWQRGYAKGYADGYGAGFSEGLASCPGPHGSD